MSHQERCSRTVRPRRRRVLGPGRRCIELEGPWLVRMSQPRWTMLHLFHLGPLVIGERRSWLLSGVTEEGAGFIEPLVGPDLPSGVATISARVGAWKLRVEPALEAVGARFGIAADPLPASARGHRAVLAFALLTSFRLFRTPGAIAALLEACAEFEKVRPWTR